MKQTNLVSFRACLLLAVAMAFGTVGCARADEVLRPHQADLSPDPSANPPSETSEWHRVNLPHIGRDPAWFRIEFQAPPNRDESWAIYLPYLYGGGQLYLNGTPLARVAQSDASRHVNWERPFLFAIPESNLRDGANVLLLRAADGRSNQKVRVPLPAIGPNTQLLSDFELRRFWVRAMPQFTVVACLICGVLALFIWWRRREELLYGLFGFAALLWGARTLTFVIEVLPAHVWPLWRLMYHSATGGFIIVLMVFSLRLVGGSRPWVERGLLGFWLLGPVGYLISDGSETLVGRVWSGGLIPIGVGILLLTALAAWRQRTFATVFLSGAIAVAVAAGVHDYLLAGGSSSLQALAPQWVAHRIFLLHFSADLLLMVMGGILSARFVAALQAVEQMNRSLESRVAEREKALAENYNRVGRLERQHATDEERQRIVRDLHDGLGSQLFVTLSRVESREIGNDGIAQALRECIADMRLTLEALSPEGNDFLEAWSNFRFRWERQLETAGLKSTWSARAENEELRLAPHAGLQLLRIAQEALTNVLKHADAQCVHIELQAIDGRIRLAIADDGLGLIPTDRPGRGLANMRARATRLRGQLVMQSATPGTRVCLDIEHYPLPGLSASANAG